MPTYIARCMIIQSRSLPHVQTMMLEIASDGALVRGTHGAVYYLVRSLEAPPELACTAKNVKLLMCIPAPKAVAKVSLASPARVYLYNHCTCEWMNNALHRCDAPPGTYASALCDDVASFDMPSRSCK